jgi:hypothetical protein
MKTLRDIRIGLDANFILANSAGKPSAGTTFFYSGFERKAEFKL